MNRKRLFLAVFLAIMGAVIWVYPMTYRIGVDGKLYVRHIPFYAKACGFLYRDWAYKDLVREIIGKEEGETGKALAILGWADKNIMRGIPAGLKALDDHPLNIIIRQYGAPDQVEDIFTILCSYAGMKAGWDKCYNADRSKILILSFVKADGRWLVFDASKNKYFMNREGKIASVDDCASGNIVMSGEDAAFYGEFLKNVKYACGEYSTRPDEQKPFRRAVFELKKMFKHKPDIG
ncbi:MAG: hypothetical protein V1682_00885 [Candidatus Omnitrophota bacterium]